MLGRVFRKAHEEFHGPGSVSRIPQVRIQRGEHPLLARLRRLEKGEKCRTRRRKSQTYLRRLHFHPVSQRGAALVLIQFNSSATRKKKILKIKLLLN